MALARLTTCSEYTVGLSVGRIPKASANFRCRKSFKQVSTELAKRQLIKEVKEDNEEEEEEEGEGEKEEKEVGRRRRRRRRRGRRRNKGMKSFRQSLPSHESEGLLSPTQPTSAEMRPHSHQIFDFCWHLTSGQVVLG
jgi:hypothetical protein